MCAVPNMTVFCIIIIITIIIINQHRARYVQLIIYLNKTRLQLCVVMQVFCNYNL
jgi:hypothetical protein